MTTRTSKITPAPKQSRARNTIESVIIETDKALKSGGESAVRVQEISAATGVSIGSIYHHFGDRDGLIRAVYVSNFERTAESDIEQIRKLIADSYSGEELRDHLDDFKNFMKQVQPREAAIERAAMIGQINGRPLLREAFAEAQNRVTNSLAEVMQILRDRGMLKEHITPRTAAILIQVLLMGRIIAQLDSDPVSDDEWDATVLSAMGGMIVFG